MTTAQAILGLLGLILAYIAISVSGHGSHSHGHGTQSNNKNTAFQNGEIIRDTEHIKEHLTDQIHQKKINQMSPEELQFQFFVAHDFNRDKILDGLEIYKSLEHAIVHLDNPKLEDQDNTTKRAAQLADDVLTKQDLNKDGCLDYREFVLGHKNAQKQ